jgi:hypothetical protein
MKVTKEAQCLVNGKCPSCWRSEGQDHDEDCLSAKMISEMGGSIRSDQRDPFENDSDWLKEKIAFYRKNAKEKLHEDPVEFVNPPKRRKLVPLDTLLNDVHREVWGHDHYPKGTVSIYDGDGERLAWDIPAGEFPIEGQYKFRICRRIGRDRVWIATFHANLFDRGLDTWSFSRVAS